ncbi:PRONE domain protein [Raphanus sativus]|nr:PRONE domain protein [Raphanus sativus]
MAKLLLGETCQVLVKEFVMPSLTLLPISTVTCLDSIDLSSELAAVEMADRVEISTYIWRRIAHTRHLISLYRSTDARASWGMMNLTVTLLIGQSIIPITVTLLKTYLFDFWFSLTLGATKGKYLSMWVVEKEVLEHDALLTITQQGI